MRLGLRKRVTLNFVLVITLFGLFGAILVAYLINRTILQEAQRRVNINLQSGWNVLQAELDKLSLVVGLLGREDEVEAACRQKVTEEVRSYLEAYRKSCDFDFLSLTDSRGRVILRTLQPYRMGDILANDPFVQSALKGHSPSGFTVLFPQRLRDEGANLEEKAYTFFEPTPKAKPRAQTHETAGMALAAAAPVTDEHGQIVGTLYAGILLNRNHALVDKIRSIVFEDKIYDGKPLGSVTLFQWDTRIATNVILANGNRAIGTRVSEEVYDKVLENGQSWSDRAFVVNDWYISAYDPIRDIENRVIGILYMGVLAKKYDDIRHESWKLYGLLSVPAVLLVLALGLLFARRLTGSLSRLADAAGRIAQGDLTLEVPAPVSDDEVRDLTAAFNLMTTSLKDREFRLHNANQELETANRSLQKLNTSYLNMLGFVSHELKNSLGVIFTSARALEMQIGGAMSEPQVALVQNICRSIRTALSMTRNYLDMARIESGELQVHRQGIDLVSDVLRPVVHDMAPVAAAKSMIVALDSPETLCVSADPQLMQIVYRNLIDNAVKYGKAGSEIRIGLQPETGSLSSEVWNAGSGLQPEQIGGLFQKFTRFHMTSETGRSAGLGLFIIREIIEKHGGSIRAESEPGAWIRFVFTLPLDVPVPTSWDRTASHPGS